MPSAQQQQYCWHVDSNGCCTLMYCCAGALAMISFYAAILMLPLADAMTLFFLNPCMTAVAAWAIRCADVGF
jgi:threonine/homoserine efflux transporter RhtA